VDQVPVFASAAAGFRSGQIRLPVLLTVLRVTPVYARRPPHPGMFVADLGQSGRWVFVFTTLDALARHMADDDTSSGVDYFSTTGADLLDQLLPDNVGLLIDPDDDHALSLAAAWLTPAASPVAE
jgi:hypothetical protein